MTFIKLLVHLNVGGKEICYFFHLVLGVVFLNSVPFPLPPYMLQIENSIVGRFVLSIPVCGIYCHTFWYLSVFFFFFLQGS